MSITQLGYFGLSVVDLTGWIALLNRLGGEVRNDSPAGSALVRVDERHHRIELTAATRDALAFMGFEVASAEALTEMVTCLRDDGHEVVAGSVEQCRQRHVMALAVTHDPDGNRVELFAGGTTVAEPFVSPVGVRSFVTGDLGVGHVVIRTPQLDSMVTFYTEALGFRVSDIIQAGALDAVFLHCNARHHTLALLRAPDPVKQSEFHHFMLEVPDLDEVGRALDRCTKAGTETSFSLGKHTNDEMVSFYVRTPSGSHVEYGTGGRLIDDATWQVQLYESPSYWGHEYLPERT